MSTATADHAHSGSLTDMFNLKSIGKFLFKAVAIGAVSYAIWHTGIARPLIEAATPWLVDIFQTLHVDDGFSFLASLIPEYAYDAPPILSGASDVLQTPIVGGDEMGLGNFLD